MTHIALYPMARQALRRFGRLSGANRLKDVCVFPAHWYVAVLLPAGLTVAALLWHRRVDSAALGWWLALTALTALTGFWRETDATLSLHLLPLWSMWLFWRAYRGERPGLVMAYAGTFLSLLCADLARALWMGAQAGYSTWHTLEGIGGAGWRDGLFMFPLLAVLVLSYARWRQCPKLRVAACP